MEFIHSVNQLITKKELQKGFYLVNQRLERDLRFGWISGNISSRYDKILNNLYAKLCTNTNYENVKEGKYYKIKNISEKHYLLVNELGRTVEYYYSNFNMFYKYDGDFETFLPMYEKMEIINNCSICGSEHIKNYRNKGICDDCIYTYKLSNCLSCADMEILNKGFCYKCFSKANKCDICKRFYIDNCSCLYKKEEILAIKISSNNWYIREFGSIYWYLNYKGFSDSKIKSLRTFGLEFEVNSKKENILYDLNNFLYDVKRTRINGFPLSDFIIVKRDGSLSEKGLEFNTCALYGEEGEFILSKIVEIFNKYFETDELCGLHLHINCYDLDQEQKKETYIFYQKFQDNFKYYVDKSRLKNRYCKRLPRHSKEKIKSSPRVDFLVGSRYHSVNYKALTEFGTIELRIMEGNLNIEKILLWINIHTKIINYFKFNSLKDSLINNKLIRKILGKELYEDLITRKEYNKFQDGKEDKNVSDTTR